MKFRSFALMIAGLFLSVMTAGAVVWDVGGDGKKGLPEAIDALQVAGGIRSSTDFTNTLGMTFNLIPAGTFMMGSTYDSSQQPIHGVTLTQPFYMMTTEVTQAQWQAVMGSNPSNFTACGGDCPVEQVSWDDIQAFITAINALGEGTYFLPTEAQWEYACRAGSATDFANGNMTEAACGLDPNLDVMGWYCYNAGSTTHPVAQKQANTWGLYDMHGNVWECCADYWYSDYPSAWVTDPEGPTSGSDRVERGGCWNAGARRCRSADRGGDSPDCRDNDMGFRLAGFPGQ
jgi:formylglycine-generating enzyme required for sulfatase activity